MTADLSIITDMVQKGETQRVSKKKQRIKKEIQSNNKPITANKRIPQNEN